MATDAITEKVIAAGAALNTSGGIGSAKTSGRLGIACTVVFGAGTAVGTITVETAPNAEYAGAWASLGTLAWTAADTIKYARFDGPVMAVRARISTAVTGGTVDVYLQACD